MTVGQFAAAAKITKQAVYKQLDNKLKPYYKLVDGQKMIDSSALKEVYSVNIEQNDNQPLNNENNQFIELLKAELQIKNEQIAAQQRQIEQLTTALQSTTESLKTAQALHAGTIQQQLEAPREEAITVQEKKKGWFHLWKR